jgi:hypothetical protein
MGTVVYSCSCSITSSMFGDRMIMSASPCLTHSAEVQKELKALADKIRSLQKANQNGTNS